MEKDKKIVAFINGDPTGERETSSSAYFTRSFEKFDYKGAPVFGFQWNWMSFLFGPIYMMWRRRYWEGALYALLSLPLSWMLIVVPFLNGTLIPWIMNWSYRRHKAKAEKFFPGNEADQLAYLSKVGGTNKNVIIIAAVLTGVTVLIWLIALIIAAIAAASMASAYYY